MRYLNKSEEPKVVVKPSVVKIPTKKYVSLDYRIAICHGASGYYTVNVGTQQRAANLEKSPEFIKWGTEWSFVNVN